MEEIADVSITAESADWLAEFTRSIVNDRLAACGNIVPRVRSIYRWEDAIEDEAEALVVLHTRQSLVPAIIERANVSITTTRLRSWLCPSSTPTPTIATGSSHPPAMTTDTPIRARANEAPLTLC